MLVTLLRADYCGVESCRDNSIIGLVVLFKMSESPKGIKVGMYKKVLTKAFTRSRAQKGYIVGMRKEV